MYGLQVSFNVTSHSTDAFKPILLERRLHNTSWEYSNLFPQGNNETCFNISGNIPCNESSGYEKGTPTCGNPDVGYCSPLGQLPNWCMLQNVSAFIDLVHRLVLQHSALWDLSSDMYWICGDNAYKWLPVGVKGACNLGRLTPATFVIPNDQLNTQSIPKHTLYKRAADNTPRLSGRPHIVQMSVANKIVSSIFIYPMITQMWDKLVRATDYLDDQIWDILDILNTTVAVQNQLIIATNQHTIVLDYLTAAQGGMCQVIGPACCHYIDPNSIIKLKLKIEDVQKLRDQYDKDNDRTKDSWWSDTFSFLNPANWFKGIGGWITGIILSLLRIVVCIFVIYVLLKLVFWCISVCKKRCRNR
ncbi:syncytin-A-like [Dendrobates tinctorius]|uniref:syncytin-A-like n=1 Tax=Dendrobates tinctorius TaxID=92724 RepID=UPI003CC9D63D